MAVPRLPEPGPAGEHDIVGAFPRLLLFIGLVSVQARAAPDEGPQLRQ
jgi:hypothetical protein